LRPVTRTVRASAAPPLDRNSMRVVMLCAVLSSLSLLVFEWGRPMGWPSGGRWVLANRVTMLLAGLLLLGLYLLARHWGWLAVRAPGPRAVRYLLLAAVGIPIGGVRALLMILLHPGAAPAELLPTHLLLGATFYPLMGVW